MSVRVEHGDSRKVLKTLGDNSIDSVVCDPPYALVSIQKRFGKPGSAPAQDRDGLYKRASAGFMGQQWDTGEVAFDPAFWAEVLRVLKPGGHVLAFGGTRSYHRLACAIEDAGFEIRDQIGWLYGCLDEATEIATADGTKPYHKTKAGDLVLCYDPATGEYSYQPVLEVVVYDYADTAYRLVGDFGEQVVSRNHRCILERGGRESFVLAEEAARQCEARIPVLESLPELRLALHDAHQGAGRTEQGVQPRMCEGADRRGEHGSDAAGAEGRADSSVRGLRNAGLEAERLDQENDGSRLQPPLQWSVARRGLEGARQQGPEALETGVRGCAGREDDGRDQPGLERRADLQEPEGCLCQPADQVRPVPARVLGDGEARRLRDGAPLAGGSGHRETADQIGVGAPHQPRCHGQPVGEPDAVCDQRTAQGVRAWRGHRTAVVRIVPFHYVGKVWCLRVPTGAFVAVRDGVAFPTGNSGFPKSHDVSKGIDKMAGAEREIVAEGRPVKRMIPGADQNKDGWIKDSGREFVPKLTNPATEAAAKWEGWGTALKPAWEPICVARKPLIGTVAANVLQHGTGALNIDGCRVGAEEITQVRTAQRGWRKLEGRDDIPASADNSTTTTTGRWPANVIHDGSDEVLAAFPADRPGCKGSASDARPSGDVFTGARGQGPLYPDDGSAARFFYSAKADKEDRLGSKHPTVKPVDLMAYLCRLVTPPGGTVLDPFAGSGTTGMACMREGFNAILIEREAQFVADIKRRIAHVSGQDAPLFAEVAQ